MRTCKSAVVLTNTSLDTFIIGNGVIFEEIMVSTSRSLIKIMNLETELLI